MPGGRKRDPGAVRGERAFGDFTGERQVPTIRPAPQHFTKFLRLLRHRVDPLRDLMDPWKLVRAFCHVDQEEVVLFARIPDQSDLLTVAVQPRKLEAPAVSVGFLDVG